MKKLLLLLCVFLPLIVFSQSDKLTLLDIYDLEYVSDPQISPDGTRILYVRNLKDVMTDKNHSNIWMINFDGSGNRPITTGNQRDYNPIWTPDGTRILYKSNKNGDAQVYLHWLDSRAEQMITNSTYSANNIQVSPNGTMIAYNQFVPSAKDNFIKMPQKPEGAKWNDPPKYIDDMNYRADGQGYLKTGNQQVFVGSIEGGTPRQVTKGDFNYGAPKWLDKGTLIFSANLHKDNELDPRNTELYRINIETGEISALTNRKGPDQSPVISPDGKRIAYTGFDDRYQGYQMTELYIMNSDGSNSRMISKGFDRAPQNLYWNDKSDALYFQYNDKGNTKIASISVSGKVSDLTNNVGGLSFGRPYSGGTFSITPDGKYAYTLGSSNAPAELGAGQGSKVRKLTDLNSDVLSVKKPGRVEEIWWKSSHDNRDIQGWICYPPDFDPGERYPLILEIHGGPFAAYGPWFATEIQLYASAGYVVLYANPRGSTSYGEEFGNLIHHNYPGEDYDDLMSGVDAVISKGFVDETNLFVTGGSGGGVLSSWIIGKTDRFKAAVVAKPVINWYSFVLYADGPGFFYKYWFPGYPWEHETHYMKRSPISLVGNVNTPAMILTGEEDYRTPIAETEQYYAALKIQGKEASMVRIPGASHGIAAQPSNLVAKVAAILSWFEKYKGENMETNLDSK